MRKKTNLPADIEKTLAAVRTILELLAPLTPAERLQVIADVREKLGLPE